MSYLEQSKQNAANREAASELAAIKKRAESRDIADFARAEGEQAGYATGVQEGEFALAGLRQDLMNLFGQRRQEPVPEQGLANKYGEEGQAQLRWMQEAARENARIRARQMGNPSADNMNILINEELKARGLQ